MRPTYRVYCFVVSVNIYSWETMKIRGLMKKLATVALTPLRSGFRANRHVELGKNNRYLQTLQ